MSDSNCAVGSDGQLKDAADIVWYHDADDKDPIAPSGPSSTPLGASSSASQVNLGAKSDAFSILLAKGNKPAAITAGSRRSTRAPKPSAKVREASSKKRSTADNTDVDSENEAPVKKYRQSTRSIIPDSDEEAPVQRCLSRRATVEDYTDEADKEGDEVMDDNEDEDVEMAYANTKALGDEDRAVRSSFFN
jgi:hypothetical protein